MKKHILVATVSLAMLAACGESQEEELVVESDPMAELAAGTGPYMVTYSDGSQTLSYSSADGTEYTGTMPGEGPATWAAVDGQVCVDPPGEAEDGSSNEMCLTMGELAEDGSWTVTNVNSGESATMRRLDAVAATPDDQIAAGTYLADIPENGPALVVWADDGLSYVGLNTQSGTWRSDGGVRCTTYGEEPETCGSPTSEMAEDGSFTAEDGENGTITVTML